MNYDNSYGEVPLIHKLGYGPDDSVYLVSAPTAFKDYVVSKGVEVRSDLPATWIHGFFTDAQVLQDLAATIRTHDIEKGLWLCWPKKTSGLQSSVSEDTLRETMLPLGWVDIKVCAIDNIWSGLKFVRRQKND